MNSPQEHSAPAPGHGTDGEEARIELLTRALSVLDREGHAGLERFLAEHPDDAKILRRRLALLMHAGLEPETGQASALPETLGDFRLIRPIGSGGMGVVWLAEQISLGREVALKIVRPDQLLFPGARERFRREVETVARLQHPGTVPVYGVGEDKGLPYFAMERVHGASLAEVLEALQGRDPARLRGAELVTVLPPESDQSEQAPDSSPLFEGTWIEVCLRIVLEVAETLEHARRRGILHRDVKPSNIMITRGGRVLLLDFGLSSRQGDARLTRSGSAVGSMAYMPPELLPVPGNEGPPAPQGPQQDVYSLGVTLYELLALVPPFDLSGDLMLMRAVLAGDATPLRRLIPSIPAEVATLVSVAMDRDRERRYEDAGALARDLGNVLAHRPIEAQAPGMWLRARRWTQRHPVAATILGAFFIGPTALLVQEVQARRVVEAKNSVIELQTENLSELNSELELALAQTVVLHQRAETALAKAMEAVDRLLVHVGEGVLKDVPGMQGVRADLLGEALEFQEWFLAQENTSPQLRERSADVALRTAEVYGWLGEFDKLQSSLGRGEELIRLALSKRRSTGLVHDGGTARLTAMLGKVALLRARVQRVQGNVRRAEEYIRAGLTEVEGLAPDDIAGMRTRAGLEVELARILQGDQRLPDAQAVLEQAIERLGFLQPDATEVGPSGAALTFELVYALDSLGVLLSIRALRPGTSLDTDLLQDSLQHHRAALELCQELVAHAPRNAEYRFRLSRCRNGVVVNLHNLGRTEEAFALQLQNVALAEELVRDFPGVGLYQADLGNRLGNLGGQLHQRGEYERARGVLERGKRAWERFFAANTADVETRVNFLACLLNLGSVLEFCGEEELALAAYGSLLEEVTDLRKTGTRHPALAHAERTILEGLTLVFVNLDQLERARATAQQLLRGALSPATPLELLSLLSSGFDDALTWTDIDPTNQSRIRNELAILAAEVLETAFERGGITPDEVVEDVRFADLIEHDALRKALDAAFGLVD